MRFFALPVKRRAAERRAAGRFPLLLPFLLAGCSLETFDALVPKDRGARLVAKDQPFAPGARGKLDVYAPSGTAAGAKLAVIVFFYGGSWNSGSKNGYGFAGQALASRGFVTVVPDYRLVPEVRYPTFLEDGAAAVKWVRANAARFGGDPDSLVIAGHSAGAYNAAMLAVDPRWLGRDKAAVKGLIGLAGPYTFLPLDGPVTRATFGGAPDLPSTQPVNHASRDDPPALLLTGDKDELVLPSNSLELAHKLEEAGVKAETRVYPGVGHVGIMASLTTLLRGKAPVLDEMAAFARRVTKRG